MTNLKRNLIKILEQNHHINMCVLSCTDVQCAECPFDDKGSLETLIDELKMTTCASVESVVLSSQRHIQIALVVMS